MPFTHVHHVKYTVSDLDRSIAFYRDQLGFELTYQADRENLPSYDAIMNMQDVKLRIGMMQHPPSGFVIALIQFQNPATIAREIRNNYLGHSSMALQVADAQGEYDRFLAAGVLMMSPPSKLSGRAARFRSHFTCSTRMESRLRFGSRWTLEDGSRPVKYEISTGGVSNRTFATGRAALGTLFAIAGFHRVRKLLQRPRPTTY